MPANSKTLRYLAGSLGLALGYICVALLSMRLAIPPTYGTPLYPAAGLALAAMLCMGKRYAPSLLVGAIVVNAINGFANGSQSLLAPTLIGIGATLQALVGAWGIHRWVSRPLLLSEPRDLALFFSLGAGLACLISPTVGSLSLLAAGAIKVDQFGRTWGSWWLGDTIGVLIGAPISLTLLGRPRKAWTQRRLSVGLPMGITTVLVALAIIGVTEWEQQRATSVFERDAANASNALEVLLREPLMALEGIHGLMLVAPGLSREEFARGTANYVAGDGPLLAMGMARRVARDDVPAFDAGARQEGFSNYHAGDRHLPGDLVTPSDEDLLAIRLIEPLDRNAAALGVNIRSVAGSRSALARSVLTGRPAASAGIQLSQAALDTTGVVIYQALFTGEPRTAAERQAALQGAVFATLRPDLLMQRVSSEMPAYLRLCLVDADPATPRRRLAGSPGCEMLGAATPVKASAVSFAGRDWQIRVYAPNGLSLEDGRSWPFAIVALASTGLLGVLLLMVTGRAQRIEDLVRARTAELKREVAEREQGSLALSASEKRFRNIFEHAPIGIVFTDSWGRFKECNPHFSELLGYSPEQLQQLSSHDITHPDDRAEDVRLAQQLMRGEITQYLRYKRYITAQGQILQVRAVVSALRHEGETKVYRLVGVVEDVGQQLKMQSLERAAQTAEASNRAKSEFLSRMSHELRTPLNAMLGFTQLLEVDDAEPLSPRQRGRTAQIQQAGWHLLEMINDTLDLSRIESGSLKLDAANLDLEQVLDEALAMIEADAAARQLSVTRDVAKDARHVLGDATRLKQVLTNLLTNAIKYNRDGGSIRVEARRVRTDTVELAVQDSGLGLSAEQLDELFQPYNRLGREQSQTQGTGIGLVIAKGLVELMGGKMSASSVPGQGSCFVLTLPATQAPEAMPARIGALLPDPASYSGSRRVVYIEDNATNAEVMRGMLAQRPQISLEVFARGQAGLAAVLAAPPDLLLLDMQLPDTDGLSVLREVRRHLAASELPVIVVSANAMPEQLSASMAAGAQRYLTKPVDVRELLAQLDVMLAEGSVN